MRLSTPLGIWGSVGLRAWSWLSSGTLYYPLKPHYFGTSFRVVFHFFLVLFFTLYAVIVCLLRVFHLSLGIICCLINICFLCNAVALCDFHVRVILLCKASFGRTLSWLLSGREFCLFVAVTSVISLSHLP